MWCISRWNGKIHKSSTEYVYIYIQTQIQCRYSCMTLVDYHYATNPTIQRSNPDSKAYGANMGLIWGRQDPGGPHVGPMNFTIWEVFLVQDHVVQYQLHRSHTSIVSNVENHKLEYFHSSYFRQVKCWKSQTGIHALQLFQGTHSSNSVVNTIISKSE